MSVWLRSTAEHICHGVGKQHNHSFRSYLTPVWHGGGSLHDVTSPQGQGSPAGVEDERVLLPDCPPVAASIQTGEAGSLSSRGG